MAVIYCRNDGSNGDGLTWANAKTTLAAAVTAAGSGGTVYVGDGHSESSGSAITITGGTAALPITVLSVQDTGNPEPPTTLNAGGTVTTTANVAININGFLYFYGINFVASFNGNAAIIQMSSGATTGAITMDTCRLALTGGHTGQRINLGYNAGGAAKDQLVVLCDTDLEFSHTGQSATVTTSRTRWLGSGSSILGSTLPTTLFTTAAGLSAQVLLSGVDLSALGSGKNLFNVALANSMLAEVFNCRLGSSVSIVTGTNPGHGGAVVRVVNSDSGNTNYRYYLHQYVGEIFQEATIVRTGGATDGTTAISRKMDTNANTSLYWPLVSDPIVVWNETTGSSLTATVEVVTDNVTLTDAEAWIEVEYLGTSGLPISSFVNDRVASVLATPASQTSSSVTWTTTGLTTPVKQKLVSPSFTPQMKGPIKVRVYLAKDTVMYFCPKVTIA